MKEVEREEIEKEKEKKKVEGLIMKKRIRRKGRKRQRQ